jgi:hypothetical protein
MFGNTPKIIHKYKADKDHAIGYDGMSQEAVKVPYTEPFFARELFDKKHGVVRLNIT